MAYKIKFINQIKIKIKKTRFYLPLFKIIQILRKIRPHSRREISKKEIKSLLQKGNPLILEIGANDGNDTLEFLQTFKNLKIYCFEPDPRAIKKFKLKINDKRCSLSEIAVSNKEGEIEFYMSGGQNPEKTINDWDASSSIKKPFKHLKMCPWIKFEKKIVIKSKKLDDWVKEKKIKNIDFIWADVQGAEKELIEGGLKTLNEKTKYFYTEFSNEEMYENQINLSEILKLLPRFKIIKIYENNVLLKNIAIKK